MKLMFASDIHGDYDCALATLDAYRAEKAEKLILLGDILYHGPRNDLPEGYAPKKVIELLNQNKNELVCVRGNCDTEVDQMVLNFPVLAEYCILYVGSCMIFATHGHNFNLDKLPPIKKGDILLHGHTHVPKCEKTDACVYLNPGSVSIPKENSAHGYMTLDENVFEWKNLDGEVYNRYEI